MKTALIFAAGTGSRWAAKGYPKQLHPLRGVPILNRTVGQLLERGARPVIVTADPRLNVPGAEIFEPTGRRWLVESIISTHSLWRGEMLGLFGDVCWTHEAMDVLCSTTGLRFLGRSHASRKTGGCPELFGWTFGPSDYDRLMRGLQVGLAHALAKDPTGEHYDYMTGAIWQPYRAIEGLPIDEHCPTGDLWVPVDDWTDDVDTPASGSRLSSVWERHEVP
jgi:hypothetical protein